MPLLTSSIAGTPVHSPSPSNTLTDPFDAKSSSDSAVENHLRVGSIALLCQNSRTRTKITCARPDHCGGNLLQFESSHNPVVILQRKVNDDSGDTEKCLVAWVTSHGDTSLESSISHSGYLPYADRSIPIKHDFFRSKLDTLHLVHGKLDRQLFVIANHIWEVPIAMLRPYYTHTRKPSSARLQEFSYRFLMLKLDMAAAEYEPEPSSHLQSFPRPDPDQVVVPSLDFNYAAIRYDCPHTPTPRPRKDTLQYMIVRTGSHRALARHQNSSSRRSISALISFPALPPSPCCSPVNGSSDTSYLGDSEDSPLLPHPATFGGFKRRRARRHDMRQVWLGILLATLVIGWVLFLSTFQGDLSFGDLWSATKDEE